MSTDHSDQPRQPASAGTTSPARPGWPEIVVGLLAMAAATAVAPFFGPLGLELDAVVYGLTLAAWSGIVCLIGFAAAALIRIRSWGAFGVRRTTWRWMGIGAAAGVVAFVLKGVVNYAVITLISFDADPQGPYHDAAGGGVLPLILTFAFLAVLTPLGEEFLFRGVVTNALLRYGPVVGVLSSSVVFALFHGINLAMTTALVVGIIAAEVMRRSGSIWPAVALHAVHNMGLPLFVLITGTTGLG
ncbi:MULTISPECIES: CPBP family intramembrane glutamic endopeptidase [unclassified Streptosporangium]|uniref:CPBP family intramembrane glutamic endopeptidase n=1 Tax=unclassified Streptosporangium TaxID=2632669 RepID=UPI002E2C2B57|nr:MULTISPECIES: CPBP family intramembrane glutamic endopeptidase [unclassified Streptosporangium]